MRLGIHTAFRSLCLVAALVGFTSLGCDNTNPAATAVGNPDIEPAENLEGMSGGNDYSMDTATNAGGLEPDKQQLPTE